MNKSKQYSQIHVTYVTVTRAVVSLVAVLVLIGGLGFAPASAQHYTGAFQSVIIQGASSAQVSALVLKYGGEVTSRLDIIQGVGARVREDALAALRTEPGVTRLTANAETFLTASSFDKKNKNATTTDYPDVTGADLAWKQGALGEGVSVAIVDTGIAQHPAFKKNGRGKNGEKIVGWVDFVDGKKRPTDPNGHGTHVAGVIGNPDVGQDKEPNGMAPKVGLVGVRVLDEKGAGNYETVIQGIQWVINHKAEYNIKVMNLSLYSLVQSPYWADPLDQAVMRAWAEGITVVVAAGNDGPKPMTISVPGNTPYVITVGAFTDNYTPTDWSDDYLTSFSAAGPTLDGFIKPDLLAPGAHITSTMMPGSYVARNHDANWEGREYFSMAGTSQAAAVVSGTSALMLAQNPGLTPDQVKYRLLISALPWVNADGSDVLYSAWQQGAGRINAYDAIFTTETSAANQGLNIMADLDGSAHFEGYSYYDETTGTFRLRGHETDTGGYGSWAGGYGSWAGGYGSWAGGYGSWAGGYGSWAGGYGSWAGGYGSWAGGYGVWAGQLVEPAFVQNFIKGISPNVATSAASIRWTEEH